MFLCKLKENRTLEANPQQHIWSPLNCVSGLCLQFALSIRTLFSELASCTGLLQQALVLHFRFSWWSKSGYLADPCTFAHHSLQMSLCSSNVLSWIGSSTYSVCWIKSQILSEDWQHGEFTMDAYVAIWPCFTMFVFSIAVSCPFI